MAYCPNFATLGSTVVSKGDLKRRRTRFLFEVSDCFLVLSDTCYAARKRLQQKIRANLVQTITIYVRRTHRLYTGRRATNYSSCDNGATGTAAYAAASTPSCINWLYANYGK
eukprot:1473834-Pleurochrysis_carterae.AAC.3